MAKCIIVLLLFLPSMIIHAMEDQSDPLINLCSDSPVFVIVKRHDEGLVKVQLLQPDDKLIDDVNCIIEQAQEELDKIDHCKLPQGNYIISKFGTFLQEKENPIKTLDLTDFCINITDEALNSIVKTCPDLEIVRFCLSFDETKVSKFLLRIPNSRGLFIPCDEHEYLFEKNEVEKKDVKIPFDLHNS